MCTERFFHPLLLSIFIMLFSAITVAVELQLKTAVDTVIEDAVLFLSDDQFCPRAAIALGDLDLNKTDYTFDIPDSSSNKNWWLIGHRNSEIVYSSNLDLSNSSLDEAMPLPEIVWPVVDAKNDLNAFTDQTTLVKFGVMSDTHYYSDPFGWGHPLERQEPLKYDLDANIDKMKLAFDLFELSEVDFATILGDMVEDHAGWDPTATWPSYTGFTPSGALYTNLGNLQSFFDQYLFDTHLVIGNHDTGFGTRRTDIYNNLTYYSQETYDADDYANRMDYTFDINGIRFIVIDNVNPIPIPMIQRGYRWASPSTLNFLERELSKVSASGVDEDMPVILMSHARIDCLSAKDCSQKVDVTDSSLYQWVRSTGGTNEYYLIALDGSNPNLEDTAQHNQFVWVNGQVITIGTIGILYENRWKYGRNDSDPIDFDTIYIRLGDPVATNSHNPSDASPGYIHYKYISEGASENFEDQMAILDAAYNNGANILAALAGHHHISDHNSVNGIEYFTFSSPKTVPSAHALVEVLHNGALYVEGYGRQATYNTRAPYYDVYDCATSLPGEFTSLWGQLADSNSSHSTKDLNYGSTKLWQFGTSTHELVSLSADIHSSGKVYESAEDGVTSRWVIHDDFPIGATVENVYDDERKSQTIRFDGDSYHNGYVLRTSDLGEWHDTRGFHLQWSMKYGETYFIRAKVKTTDGSRYLRYTAADDDALESTGLNVNFGLGSHTKDGQWRTFTRDLKADLARAQPELEILEVLAFYVQGDGQVDDVKLHTAPPAVDTDNDGISDENEESIYQTDPYSFDTDSDGIADGIELIFWEENWNVDTDNDGLINLLDPDSDEDGTNDGIEIDKHSDPLNPASMPAPTVYEDAEDSGTSRWQIYDNNPLGAMVSNVLDGDRQSRVIELIGDSYNNGYALRNSALQEWNDASGFVLEWSGRFDETYIIQVKIKTSNGNRYLRYTPVDIDTLGAGTNINFGLGSTTQDGQWRTFVRDLNADLKSAQSSLDIIEVLAFFVQGSGRVDDVKLHSSALLIETDKDGISNVDEQNIYQTNPEIFDSDNDDIGDGDEVLYWGTSWNGDSDNDGVINLLDSDSDNDGYKDGEEIHSGHDPADSNSYPPSLIVFEDAEDGSIARWEIYKDISAGAVISNIFDSELQSRVIRFDGDSYFSGYALRTEGMAEWHHAGDYVLEWSMKYEEVYIFTAKVSTTLGNRYIRYTAANGNALGSDHTVSFGLGSDTQDGRWRTFVRDLAADLAQAQPNAVLLEVLAFFVQGSGQVDSVNLYNQAPPLDSDNDGISDADEQYIYFTDPLSLDSDNDGITDGSELILWAGNWSDDIDNDGLVNLLDPDADADGISDGLEVSLGSDPGDSGSRSLPIIYENAEDLSSVRWKIYDDIPSGALITTIFDNDRQSEVIEFDGDAYRNGYVLRNSHLAEWKNNFNFVLEWSMKYDETYIIQAKLKTSAGNRYLRYTAVDSNGLGSSTTVNFGLGSTSKDGRWHTFARDLKADLALAQPSVEVYSVEAFFVKGDGRVDDVKLHASLVFADSDQDGISNADELSIYLTDPAVYDTDGDGLGDGEELLYWGSAWSNNIDADAFDNLLDIDADNDGVNDRREFERGSNPADSSSIPVPIVYEDAEDSSITRWEIYKDTDIGALITNVFDDERQSRVIRFFGDGYYSGYALRKADMQEWHHENDHIIEWSMKYAETYIVTAKVTTTSGNRYLRYTASNTDSLGSGQTVNFGLGASSKDGEWHTYIRDLTLDLQRAQPDTEILEVLAIFVAGSGSIDDVKLHSALPQ